MTKESNTEHGGSLRHLETLLVHGPAEESTGAAANGATLPPVVFSTAFAHESAEQMEAIFAGQAEGEVYSRLQNPTVKALESRITAACGARGTLAVASGMTAIGLGALALLKAGDEIVVGRNLFGGSYTLFDQTLRKLGITPRFIDARKPAEAKAALNANTKAVFLEAIANPAMVVPDFAVYRELCSEEGIPLLVDATLLTPCGFDAEALGADLAFFSASKFIAGAASLIGGFVVDTGRFDWGAAERFDFSDVPKAGPLALLKRLRNRLMSDLGPCLSPMNAFLLLTGLETLPLRLDRQERNALAAADFLRYHPKVAEVRFPGLPDSPDYELCRRQFAGHSGSVLGFSLAGKAECFRMLNALKLVRRASNLGDTKSLAVHPASTIYGTYWPHEQEQVGVTESMIRLSLGIEHPEDIIADLAQALEA